PFSYLNTYRVLVCQTCRYACVSDEVPTQLRSKRKDMTPAARCQVAEAVSENPGIIKNQSQLAAEFRFPQPTIPPISELDPPQPDGRACRQCRFVSWHDQQIQQHCATCQKWTNPQVRGRPRSNNAQAHLQKPWREDVMWERFFKGVLNSTYFNM
ncbi:hypothetical protein QL093DRAFT_1995809, partial [Fusarium oxysporum]